MLLPDLSSDPPSPRATNRGRYELRIVRIFLVSSWRSGRGVQDLRAGLHARFSSLRSISICPTWFARKLAGVRRPASCFPCLVNSASTTDSGSRRSITGADESPEISLRWWLVVAPPVISVGSVVEVSCNAQTRISRRDATCSIIPIHSSHRPATKLITPNSRSSQS